MPPKKKRKCSESQLVQLAAGREKVQNRLANGDVDLAQHDRNMLDGVPNLEGVVRTSLGEDDAAIQAHLRCIVQIFGKKPGHDPDIYSS